MLLRTRACVYLTGCRRDSVPFQQVPCDFSLCFAPSSLFSFSSLCKEKESRNVKFRPETLQPCFLSFNREHTELCMTTALKMKMKFPSGMVIISSMCNQLMMAGCMVLFRELGKQECFQQIILSLLTNFCL